MTHLSVNINKIATLRNARGGNLPDVIKAAHNCEKFGAEGITVHPRPDERHIRYADIHALKAEISTEFNIEGYPSDEFMKLVTTIKPAQVTLVPDQPDAITSNAGWDTIKHEKFLSEVIAELHAHEIRTSIFIETNLAMIENAVRTGTDRLELYTEAYAQDFPENPEIAIKPYLQAAQKAREVNLELNAGHDLNLENLTYFVKTIPWIKEVSIGHALISDALYYGLEKTIGLYLNKLRI